MYNNRGHRRNNNGGGFGFNENNNNGYQNPLSARIGNNNDVHVEFRNWQGGSRDNLVDFIYRKSQIRLRNVRVSGPVLHADVSYPDARPLAKYHGIRFAGASLDIRVFDDNNKNSSSGSTGGPSPSTRTTIQLLEEFLNSRYNTETKYLNLESLRNDEFLVAKGLYSSSKMFPALMKIAGERIPDVQSVSLRDNSLIDVSTIISLPATYPNLKNLSLADNNITSIQSLEAFKHKLPHLRELILSGNMITNSLSYKDDMIKLFPRLVVLDGQVVQDESQIDKLKLPIQTKNNFFENDSISEIAASFLQSFFDRYDKNRADLMQLYDEQSTFSINLNTASPRQLGGTGVPTLPGTWKEYIPLSRNLLKVNSPNAQLTRLCVGPEAIAKTFQRLPRTNHEFSGPEKFAVDVWNVKDIRALGDQGIMIFVHGEFREPDNALRSFDRNFILLPGPYNNMIVTSDILTIRPYSGVDGWKELPLDTASSVSNTPVPAVPGMSSISSATDLNLLDALPPQQKLVVRTLMEKTRLNTQFALMCAEQAQFDLQNALQLFEQSKLQNTIPPNAFIP